MINILKKIYYWVLCPDPYFKIYPKLDVLLFYLESVGIKEVNMTKKFSCSYMNVTFKDNTTAKVWYSISYSLFMSQGEINFSNGKKLVWEKNNPSREIAYKYRKIGRCKVKELKNKENINNDFSEYLPLKYKRKMKLNKLNK